eukprot:1154925-Pelagomonas_calceolata.AAC.4
MKKGKIRCVWTVKKGTAMTVSFYSPCTLRESSYLRVVRNGKDKKSEGLNVADMRTCSSTQGLWGVKCMGKTALRPGGIIILPTRLT